MAKGMHVRSRAALEEGPAAAVRAKAAKKATAQGLLKEMLEALSRDRTAMREIYATLVSKARAGDKDALDFIGKYLLGGGKITSEDMHRAPAIRPSRR